MPTEPAAPRRRGPSAAEVLGVAIGVAQGVGSGTLAMLSLREPGSFDEANSALAVTGVVFGLLGVVVFACSLMILRHSLAARFGLVGAEVLLGVVAVVVFHDRVSLVGVVVAVSAVLVVLLVTILAPLGRPRG